MTQLNPLIIVATAAIIFVLFYQIRYQIIGLVWKIFFKYVSDEKLEKIVRREYENYDVNRRAYNEDGLCWLIEMAQHLCSVWKNKIAVLQDICKAEFPNNIKSSLFEKQQEQSRILSYWQDALRHLTYEANRRKYFVS